MKNKPRHVCIVRFHYPEGHPDFEWRFAYFQAFTLPSILRQQGVDFDVAIWCNEAHADRFRKLSPRVIPFGTRPEYDNYVKKGCEAKAKQNGGKYHVDFVPWKAVVGLDKYEFQHCIDSDDFYLNENLFKSIESLSGEKAMHVSFQPYIFHVPTLRTYSYHNQYSIDKGSAVYSIYQPAETPDDRYVFGYDDSHLVIGRQFPDRKFIGYEVKTCAFSVHEHNSSTILNKKAVQVFL